MVEKELKKKKKKWFAIHAGPEFNKTRIGETPASEASEIIGRTIKVNLAALTNDPKKQGYTLLFKITKCENDIAYADMIQYRLGQSHVRKLSRKGIKKIEDSFLVTTKDNVSFRVKPLLITRFKTQRSIGSALHHQIKEHLTDMFKTLESKDAFLSVIGNKVQMELKGLLKKTYPIAISEIRILQKTKATAQQTQPHPSNYPYNPSNPSPALTTTPD